MRTTLIENEERTRQALRGIRAMLAKIQRAGTCGAADARGRLARAARFEK
jgi:hypothetical protein